MNEYLPNLAFWRSRHLPVILQTEAAECALASLCMVSAYWGKNIDIATVRRQFRISLKGVTLRGMISIAERLSLNSRPVKLDLDHLGKLKIPCILHWDLNHFVVLKSVKNNRVEIHDPAVGFRRMSLKEFGGHFSGVAVEIVPDNNFKKEDTVERFSIRGLMGNVVGLPSGLTKIFLLGLSIQVCMLVSPFYVQWIVDEALLTHDRDLIMVLGLGFLLLALLQVSITAVRSWMTTSLSTNINFQWLGNAFGHLMVLPLEYFEKRFTSDTISRFSSIEKIQRGLTSQFVTSIVDGILVACTFAMMVWYSGRLASIALCTLMLYLILRMLIHAPLKNASSEQIIHSAKQQNHMMESIRGIQTIRLFGRGPERRRSWISMLAEQFNADLKVARLGLAYQTANSLLFGIERIVVIWLAALYVLDNRFSVGMLFAFISYKDQFTLRAAGLVDKFFEFRMLSLHAGRVADVLLTEKEVVAPSSEFSEMNAPPSIEFVDVSFRYGESEPLVLKSVSFTILPGQSVAITGSSGGGKTTLIKLLLGLLIPTSGSILSNGIAINKIGVNEYRSIVATVMQEDLLFIGSILDNISFFDPAPDLDLAKACAHLAAISQEIALMSMAYNTLVGEGGTGLSGGQKQRVLLARALYKRPKLLVLDEATSSLDSANELAVNESVRKLGLTRIIIAHRRETIDMADRVLLLNGGYLFEKFSSFPPEVAVV
jgi:ATP-binding cassette subfamily B protein RaxB